MTRPARTVLALGLLAALAVPGAAESAGCASALPVSDMHVSSVACSGVHVGMLLRVPSEKHGTRTCAASFAFTDQFKHRYVTFPGTCYLYYDCLEDLIADELPAPLDAIVEDAVPICVAPSDSETEPYFKKGGPVIRDLDNRRVGSLVYAVNRGGVDFAIARIDSDLALDPTVPFFGGPRRMGPPGQSLEEVRVYSPPRYVASPNARAGVLHSWATEPYVHTEGLLSVDAGASVLRPDGTALGFLRGGVTIGLGWGVEPLGPGLERAVRRTKLDLRLMTGKR